MTLARAVLVHAHGEPDRLGIGVREVGLPGAGEVLVRVAAIGVNFVDIHERQGAAPYDKRGFPFVPGSEGAGVVIGVGAGVFEVKEADRVAWWIPRSGSYAEQLILAADRLVPVPPQIGLETAAAALVQGLTAQYLVTSTFDVAPGDPVVIHSAAGGVGLLLTQIARMRGARIVATASTEEKRRLALEAGADEATDYDGLLDAVQAMTNGEGAAVVYDGVGRATFDNSLAALRERGLLVLYGAASGKVPQVDLQMLAARGSLYVTHPALRSYVATRPELLRRSSELFRWISEGRLAVRIGKTFPLADACLAHEALSARRTMGKLLLVP